MPGNWKFDCFFFILSMRAFSNKCKFETKLSKVILLFAIRFSIYFLVNFSEHYLTKWKKQKKFIRINHRAEEYTHTQTHWNLPIKCSRPEKKPHHQKKMRKKEDEWEHIRILIQSSIEPANEMRRMFRTSLTHSQQLTEQQRDEWKKKCGTLTLALCLRWIYSLN